MDDIIELIYDIEKCIFNYNLNELNVKINKVIDYLSDLLSNFNNDGILKLNEILNYLHEALQSNDYLLYADILYYEFLPFVAKL